MNTHRLSDAKLAADAAMRGEPATYQTMRDRDVYDCPAGRFMVLGEPSPTLRIVWLTDGAERDVNATALGNCVLLERGPEADRLPLTGPEVEP